MSISPDRLDHCLDLDLIDATGSGAAFWRSCSSPSGDFSHIEASARSLSLSLWKKFLPRDSRAQDARALVKFDMSNSLCQTWTDTSSTTLDEELLGSVKSELWSFFNPNGYPLLDLDHAFLLGRCGPGSSLRAVNGDAYTKLFASPLTCSSRALVKHYQANVLRWPTWRESEEFRSLNLGAPDIVDGSLLSFVPKNDTISRAICTEPALNMFYQLGIGQVITRQLNRRYGIYLETQPDVNRELARTGSSGEHSWSTLDLESASDTISLRMCEAILPKEAMAVLRILRSPVTHYKGRTIPLYMISSMGNGFTFPLQTAIFSAAVSAVYDSVGLPLLRGRAVNFGVFGDDIVIHRLAWTRLTRLLAALGFIVNTAKSFSEGPFRESCGHDYFKGRNVRGVYLRSLETMQDRFAAINALNEFTARTGLSLPRTCRALYSTVDKSMEVPLWEDPSSGLRIPLSMLTQRSLDPELWGYRYKRYVPKRKTLKICTDFIYASRKGRVLYNSAGLLTAAVAGWVDSSGLPVREDVGRWKRKRASCSFWDSDALGSSLPRGESWRRLEDAVYANLKA
jgi:hypothetical protein